MSKGYTTITEAIIKGFERLLEPVDKNIQESSNSLNDGLVMSLQDRIENLEKNCQKLLIL
jgi:hypothetical protein